MARQGLNPRFNAKQDIPTFEEIAQQVHIERMPTLKNAKHGQQWINTLRDYAFPKIGRMPIDSIGEPEVLMCLSPIWTKKHETARRLAQRIKVVLDVAKSKGFRSGENPVTAIKDGQVLPKVKVKVKVKHHKAMAWQDIPAFWQDLSTRKANSAKALMSTCLTGSRTNETLGAEWEEFDFVEKVWIVPDERMKPDTIHRVPLTEEMPAIIEPLKAEVVAEIRTSCVSLPKPKSFNKMKSLWKLGLITERAHPIDCGTVVIILAPNDPYPNNSLHFLNALNAAFGASFANS